MFWVTLFLLKVISPRLHAIQESLFETEIVEEPVGIILMLFGVLLGLLFGAWRYGVWHISDRRQVELCEAALSMQAHMEMGATLPEAAKRTIASMKGSLIRKRMNGFVSGVEAGLPWDKAWQNMRLGSEMENWLIETGAAREEPAEAFDQLAEWIQPRLERKAVWIATWYDPIITCVLVGVTAVMAWTFLLKPLVDILEGLRQFI